METREGRLLEWAPKFPMFVSRAPTLSLQVDYIQHFQKAIPTLSTHTHTQPLTFATAANPTSACLARLGRPHVFSGTEKRKNAFTKIKKRDLLLMRNGMFMPSTILLSNLLTCGS